MRSFARRRPRGDPATLQVSREAGISRHECVIVAELLEAAANDYAGHSSNDYLVADTPANKSVLSTAIRFHNERLEQGERSTLTEVGSVQGELFIYDDWLMRYLADRWRMVTSSKRRRSSRNAGLTPGSASGRSTGPPQISEAELALTADLLSMLAEDHYSLYAHDEGDEDFMLPASAEHAELAAAVREFAGRGELVGGDAIRSEDSAGAVFTVDLMRYLAQSCRDSVGKAGVSYIGEDSAAGRGAKSEPGGASGEVSREAPGERLGVLKTWLSEKAILKRMAEGSAIHDASREREAAELAAYAGGGNEFRDSHERDRILSPPLAYAVGAALGGMRRARVKGICTMFGHESHEVWMPFLARAAAEDYWALRIHNNDVFAVAGDAASFHGAVTLLAECLVLGWMEESRALAELIRLMYQKHRFNLGYRGFTFPLSHWLLRIAFDHFGLAFDGWGDFRGPGNEAPWRKGNFESGQCFGEPVLNKLVVHWADPNLEPFRDELMWLCDYYTHRTRPVPDGATEFSNDLLHTRFPGAVLAWFRLREARGLANPVIDHPLMKPAYARLPAPRPFYDDEELHNVVARLKREEIPDLGSLTRVELTTWSARPDPRVDARFDAVPMREFRAPGFGLAVSVPVGWQNRCWDDVVCYRDPVTAAELAISGYKNASMTYQRWADVRFAAFATAAPGLRRIRERYEVRGTPWWGLAEDYRGEWPGVGDDLHVMLVCFKSKEAHPNSRERLIAVTVTARREVFTAEDGFYRWMLHWKLVTWGVGEVAGTLGPEYQDVPGVQRVPWQSVIADAEQQCDMGMAYLRGEGVTAQEKAATRDPEFAVRWLLRAASQGHARAQYQLAVMYSQGQGVVKDLEEALIWCRRSAAQGFEPAVKGLSVLQAQAKRSIWSRLLKRK